MRKLFYFISFCMIGQAVLSGCASKGSIEDPEQTHFIKFYGGDGDQTGEDFVVLPDGSLILFGTTKPSGTEKTSQWYMVKTDPRGALVWEKKFGSPLIDEIAKDIEITANGRLVAVGNSVKGPGNSDVRIMTFSLDGVPADSAIVALKDKNNLDTDEDVVSVSLTSDGFIVAGSTNNTDVKPSVGAPVGDTRDNLQIRFYNNLLVYPSSWRQGSGPGTYDAAIKILQISASPDQFVIFGYSNKLVGGSHLGPDLNFFITSLGATGEANGADIALGSNDDERLSSMANPPLNANVYLLGGITYNQSGSSDLYIGQVFKKVSTLDPSIPFEINSSLAAPKPLSVKLGLNVPEKTSMFPSNSGGYYLLANEKNFNDNQNWILIKLNFDGTTVWTLPIIFGGEGLDTVGSLQELPDGRVVMIGTMRTGKPDAGEFKMTLIKVNGDGKLLD